MAGAQIWALLGPRAGDNAQVRGLAQDLGLGTREITLRTNLLRELPNGLLGASLVTLRDPVPLGPPWPRAVIGIGRRSVPAARWIGARSGGQTRLIHLGRPRADLARFDLVLGTPQYGLPDAPNLVRLTLPWQGSPAPVPPADPCVLALLGGPSWAQRPTAASVAALVAAGAAAAARHGLPLVAVTGPRTTPDLAAALRQAMAPRGRVQEWRANDPAAVPYRALLAAAAEIVLTGDSVSALADAVWTDRPVTVVAAAPHPMLALLDRWGGGAARHWRRRGGNWALFAPPPDLRAVQDRLIEQGLALPSPPGLLRLAPCRAVLAAQQARALARVRACLSLPDAAPPG